MEYYKLGEFFFEKVISADVHCRKPDTEIYKIMLNRLGTLPNNCIFIDNSVENLRTARDLGMDVILFNRDNEEFEGKTVYSFEELAGIL